MKIEGLKIGIIGAGNLGKAMAQGLLDGGYPAESLTLTRRNTTALEEFSELGISVHSDNKKCVEESDVVILAVKPYNVLTILDEISENINPKKHMIVSVVTGVGLNPLSETLPKGTPLFRAMPNTAADVKESLT